MKKVDEEERTNYITEEENTYTLRAASCNAVQIQVERGMHIEEGMENSG
jgi:hypothetical protein